jgi:membrane protein
VAPRAAKAWVAHRAPSKGAALAFYTLFSLAPILVLVLAVCGYFFGEKAAQGEILAQLEGLLGAMGASAVQSVLAQAHAPGAGGTATGLAAILVFVGATTVFAELKDSLDEIWGVQKNPPAGILAVLKARILSFGLVLVLAFLLLVSLVINALLSVLGGLWAGLWAQALPVVSILSHLFSFGVIASLFAVIFRMLPEATLSWPDVTVGALATAGLFNLGKSLIGVYLGHSAVGSSFGAAGSVAALLVWVYYSAQIFFLGAEFTREYALTFGSLRERGGPGAPEGA